MGRWTIFNKSASKGIGKVIIKFIKNYYYLNNHFNSQSTLIINYLFVRSLIQSKKNGPIVQKVLQFFVAHVNSKK